MPSDNDNKDDVSSEDLDDANPYFKQLMKVTSERNALKEKATELETSIQVYKEMLVDRDTKLKELTDKIIEHTNGATIDNNSYEGIMLTLNQNAHLIKSLATSKNKHKEADPKTVE